MIRVSLIVPTYNRAEYLNKSLETFANQTLDKSSYEIILVDNNSSDDTKKVFNILLNKFPEHNWTYFFEPKQGLHFARNRGILLSRGEVVVFGDDDIEASPKWLESLLTSFEKDEKIGIAGGPIIPIWDKPPPEWIYDYGTKEVHGVFAYLNYGNESKYLENEILFGCNFAIRKKIAIEIHGSGPDTFPDNMIHYSGYGERAMELRVEAKGYKCYYNAEAVVEHHCPVSRCTLAYFANRYKRWAVEGIYQKYNTGISLYSILLDLIQKTVDFISQMFFYRRALEGKINKKYFLFIQWEYIVFRWKHFGKLLTDPKLRQYTKLTNHLWDLASK